jgi:hypothetical protein
MDGSDGDVRKGAAAGDDDDGAIRRLRGSRHA